MQQYHSLVDPELLLATVLNTEVDIRQDAAGTEEILQVSVMRLPSHRVLDAHRHLPTSRSTQGTQEAWVVMRGVLAAELFDIDGTSRSNIVLRAGDCMTLYRGAHSFRVIEEVVMFEIKNGPYLGRDKDSERI